MQKLVSIIALAIALAAAPALAQPAAPTVADARAFVAEAEAKLLAQSNRAGKVYWINQTYITDDSDALAAQQGEEDMLLQVSTALAAAKFDKVPGLDAETKRKLLMLRTGLVLPAPTRDGAAAELASIATRLGSLYGKGKGPLDMVKYGEAFFTSLGLAPLPDTFWTRSQFVKPADREVVCHASAWNLDNKDDLRIKMCIKVNANA